jgi:hypothetical protein
LVLLLAALLASAAAAPAIDLVADPPEPDCPRRERVLQALELRLGDTPQATARPWRLSYAVTAPSAAPGQRDIRIALAPPAGEPRLRRALRIGVDDCAAGAEAVAVVVEEYFRGVGWTRGQALPSPAIAASAPPPIAARSAPRLLLVAGAAGGYDRSGWLRARLGARVRVAGPLHVALTADLPGRSRTEPAGGGEARLSSWPGTLALPLVLRRSPLELEAGPELGAALERAETREVSRGAAQSRTTLAIGLGAGAALQLAPRWRLVVGVSGQRAVLGSEFVFNQSTQVLAIPRWRVLAHVALGWEFF